MLNTDKYQPLMFDLYDPIGGYSSNTYLSPYQKSTIDMFPNGTKDMSYSKDGFFCTIMTKDGNFRILPLKASNYVYTSAKGNFYKTLETGIIEESHLITGIYYFNRLISPFFLTPMEQVIQSHKDYVLQTIPDNTFVPQGFNRIIFIHGVNENWFIDYNEITSIYSYELIKELFFPTISE